jgi:hypothetical protein
MRCKLCASGRVAEFPAEMNIHFSGLKNLDRPQVLVFPKILLCLDCGFSCLTIPEAELQVLREGNAASTAA